MLSFMQWLDRGCLSGLQGLVAMFGYMGCNRHLLKQRRAFGPIGASENLSKSWIRERNQKHLSLLKTFYKLFYWIKKESTNNNYNGLPGVWSLVDRYICKPVSNR